LVELLTITVLEVIVCFVYIGGIVDHHCFRGDCLFTKQTITSKTVMVNNSTNIYKAKQSPLNSDGQQFYQYIQKYILVELLTITVLEVIVCFVDIGGIVDHHCFRGDCLFCIYWWNC
jgi:hypothetical protein